MDLFRIFVKANVGVSFIIGSLLDSSCLEETYFFNAVRYVGHFAHFHQILLELFDVIKVELSIQVLEIFIELFSSQGRWVRMVDHERVLWVRLDYFLGSLDVANNHKLLHYLLGGESLFYAVGDRPFLLI